MSHNIEIEANDVALVGMSGRFPGANSVNAFWEQIMSGVVQIRQKPSNKVAQNNFVEAFTSLENIEYFDAEFFNYSAKDAEMMDPQHRLFLECLWEALEHSNTDPERYKGKIGVFAGSSISTYLLEHWEYVKKNFSTPAELARVLHNNAPDYLTSKAAYKLNLTGPAVTVQTACSTSLVSVHIACLHLQSYQCDMALAGGVTVQVPQAEGYFYETGSMLSPSGHCVPFDINSDGTIFSSGVGVVALKRYEDAVNDRDVIFAVIKSTSINNDGNRKVGFTAPSMQAQLEVINEAVLSADITPDRIGYVECHGTGTSLGDPIEVQALSKAYNALTNEKNFCAIGSLKSNFGHMNAASGVAGLIKAALIAYHECLPPQAGYTSINKNINLDDSPFYVNTMVKPFEKDRYVAVSSFGIGGTNAHIILNSIVSPPSFPSYANYHLIPISAKNKTALEAYCQVLATFIAQQNLNISDIAYTLQRGRQHFSVRYYFICKDISDLLTSLLTNEVDITIEDEEFVHYKNIGDRWQHGESVAWEKLFYQNEKRNKITLPGYCFQRQYYWFPTISKNHNDENQIIIENSVSYDRPDLKVPYAAPEQAIEKSLTQIISKILSLKLVGIDDNFYDLGGDSLLAMQYVSHIESIFLISISVNMIDQYPVIRQLAPQLEKLVAEKIADMSDEEAGRILELLNN